MEKTDCGRDECIDGPEEADEGQEVDLDLQIETRLQDSEHVPQEEYRLS